MKRARYILRYFHVPTLSWMGGRCYDDLGRAADDYVKLATKSRDSVSRVEIYDHGSDPQYRAHTLYERGALLFVDDWADDAATDLEIRKVHRARMNAALSNFFGSG
jgi:hypothetical protein